MGARRFVLIDADSLLYQSSALQKKVYVPLGDGDGRLLDDENKALHLAREAGVLPESVRLTFSASFCVKILSRKIDSILDATDATDFILYVGGDQSNSHKTLIYPAYKSNRTTEKPPMYAKLKGHMVSNYETRVCAGWEADDAVVYDFYYYNWEPGTAAVIAAIDKDILRFVPGTHYNYGTDTWISTSEDQASTNFACAVISGDSSDNIKGLNGFGEVSYSDIGDLELDSKTAKEFLKEQKDSTNSPESLSLVDKLKISYKVYCANLKALSKKEIQRKFIINCHLLWVPLDCYRNIDSYLSFSEIFGE